MASVLWKNCANESEGVILRKENGETIHLVVGSFFTYGKRSPFAVRLESFTTKENAVGPIGIIYLPWRPESERWAEPAWSIKGNPRHIIAFPVGVSHYGEQINWENLELCQDPQRIKNE